VQSTLHCLSHCIAHQASHGGGRTGRLRVTLKRIAMCQNARHSAATRGAHSKEAS